MVLVTSPYHSAHAGPAGRTSPAIVVIAHRGEHLHHPENTLAAVEAAIRLGVDYVEIDLRTTADGVLVLNHDPDVERCTNGRGAVIHMTLAELRALDAGLKVGPEFAGTRIPTLAEALDLARGRVRLYLDVKHGDARTLVSEVQQRGMSGDVIVYSRAAKEIETLDPKITVIPEPVDVETAKAMVALLHPRLMALTTRAFTPEAVAVGKAAHAGVFVDRLGTTDDPAGWQAAIEGGASGLLTDHPEELLRFLRASGHHN